jgi:hypothetical protein
MKDIMGALDSIGKKVGTAAAVLAAYLFFQVQELNEKVDKLESKTEAITEIKADLASIKTSVDLILKYNLKEIKMKE